MPLDTEGANTNHVAIPAPGPPTTEPKWMRMLRAVCDRVAARFRRGNGTDTVDAAQATLLSPTPPAPHVAEATASPEPKPGNARLGTAPDEQAAKPPLELADVLSPQRKLGHPPFSPGGVPTRPQPHVVRPGDPPTTDEPKLTNPGAVRPRELK